MTTNALIIFVRKPELGKVKTRLAATVGNTRALHIYRQLLRHTFEVTKPVAADKFVYYADDIEADDLWSTGNYFKKLQVAADLGTKMKAAFTELFTEGYENVAIIGSDCFELTTPIIEQAFNALAKNDVVIGPATDGGYYLLGMKKMWSPVFADKQWSTGSVFKDTVADIKNAGCAYATLPLLTDVDEAYDLPENFQFS